MTVSKHVYAAVLLGSPNLPLSVRGGSITLDESAAPHVQGDLDIAMPSLATLAALDPRALRRVRVSATSDIAGSRTFNLALRGRSVALAEGLVRLSLASDEALLTDYAPLSDIDLYDRAGDLRALARYVLGVALGSQVTITGPTADLTPHWDATNLCRNPSFETGAHGWGVAGGGGDRDTAWKKVGGYSLRITGTSIDSYAGSDVDASLKPGTTYTASADYRVGSPLGGTSNATRARRIVAFVKAPSLGEGYVEYYSPAIANATNAQVRLAVTFDVPTDATEVFVRFYNGHTSGSVWIDAVSVTADNRNTTYFDGSWPPSPGYTYFWNGTAHDSTSQRHAVIESPEPDAFLWKAGQSALDFLAPLLQAAGLRLVCDEVRTWTTRDESFIAPGTLSIRHGINLVDALDDISRTDESWFDAVVTVYSWIDANGFEQTRTDSYALPGYTRLRVFERRVPYPGPGFSEYAVRRAQGRGRGVTATTVADWSGRTNQPVVIVLDGVPVQTGQTSSVRFDLDRDEMTITTRTTDTPLGAIDLLPGTINALAGSIDSL